ncbi:MAG: hypothetical protein GEU26_17175 [Nitrososphaeraceae archaeon]|nr:hypothetical protein [Nitrososphaeraceae archaeon]
MPTAIPEMIKSRVREQWLHALSRDAIARDNNISAGAVSNIIKEWTNALGKYEADALRELVKSLKSSGLSPAQCATGFRIMKIFEEQGMDAEAAEHFMSETYKKCNELAISPTKVCTHINDLTEFSNDIRLPEIKNYINQKLAEKREVESKLHELNQEVCSVEKKKSELLKSCDLILEKRSGVTEEMNLFFETKQELDKHKLSINQDLPKFARTVKTISAYEYDPERVLAEFEDIYYLDGKRRALKIATDEAQRDLVKLKDQDYLIREEDSLIRKAISRHSFNISVYDELERAGFGASNLSRLLHTILSITEANGISYWLAVDKFFKDIETQYDAKLGFEDEKERLEIRIKMHKEELDDTREKVRIQPFVGPTIWRLFQLGLSEKDIVKFGEVFHGILNRTFPVQEIAQGMIYTINVMKKTMTDTRCTNTTASNEKNVEILNKAKNDLEELEFSN